MYKLLKRENLTKNFFNFMMQINFDKEIRKLIFDISTFKKVTVKQENHSLLTTIRINIAIFCLCFFPLWLGGIILTIKDFI